MGPGDDMTSGLSCVSCGASLPPGSKFCNQCGAAVATASVSAEYKQVTVLFADVVRSMDLAARVDIERFREIMGGLVDRCAAAITRYGGSVEYTGDGVMAIFGAPAALEDHAFRACLAAMEIQREAARFAPEVVRRDGVALQVRVGLNSGQVIIGPGSLGHAASGETIGFAQRMESAAPPGGVLLSESTARLVEGAVVLADPEGVRIKGSDRPVGARRLLAVSGRRPVTDRVEATLVGRGWEMAALQAVVDRAAGGRGGVVEVVGPPGIGKSRTAREVAALAAARGFEVVWAFCESHASDIPFQVVARLLRAAAGVADLDAPAARAALRQRFADTEAVDLLLLDDLLGVADPEVPVPAIDPDARRRRLTALVNAETLARATPALFVIEDVHWIDTVSESMLADFLDVIGRSPSVVVFTSRPEYQGVLSRAHGIQTIALGPLGDSEIAAMIAESLGPDPSVSELMPVIAERAAGNPFFAEEILRELAQRGVLTGRRGAYRCDTDAAEVTVPATVQAAIAARIDRLGAPARQTINAAAVIGGRFEADLLAALGIDPALDELLDTELVDQVQFHPHAEYAFHHPLIRAVAYESQLKTDRAQWHRRVATAVEQHAPEAAEENAALIAEHLEAAGELSAAYGWRMRAATWSSTRDLDGARISWERARAIADELPDDTPGLLAMRIAPRTMLCATAGFGTDLNEGMVRFDELRHLCEAAGDKLSLAVGMSGLATDLAYARRTKEGARLASEQMALLESIGDPAAIVGLGFVGFFNWFFSGEFDQLLRWTQIAVDLADGDSTMGAGFGLGSPLAAALAWRGTARWWLNLPGWTHDLRDANQMARWSNPIAHAAVFSWTYGLALQYGAIQADDEVVLACEEAVQVADSSNWTAVGMAKHTLAAALLSRASDADRNRGLDLMLEAREIWCKRVQMLVDLSDVWIANERARRGERDPAISAMRRAVDAMTPGGGYAVWGGRILVETLLERGTEQDCAEAQGRIDELSNLAGKNWAILDITLLRLRALLARAQGDDVTYRKCRDQYRAMAKSLGYEGHIAWAQAMT